MTYKPGHLGHVNLYVRDVERSERFYAGVLGLQSNERRPGFAVFMAADGESSHEIALMQLGPDAAGPGENRVGLNHIAWRMDSFEDLKEIHRRLQEHGVEIDKVADHGFSLGIYFQDPDGNGNEVYYELPKDQWPNGAGVFGGHFPMSLEDEPTIQKAG